MVNTALIPRNALKLNREFVRELELSSNIKPNSTFTSNFALPKKISDTIESYSGKNSQKVLKIANGII
jgi:hypothetical protein